MPKQPTPQSEADLWFALHDAMDGNLRVSRRRELLASYRTAVRREAADEIREDARLRQTEGEDELAQYGQELADLIAPDRADQ